MKELALDSLRGYLMFVVSGLIDYPESAVLLVGRNAAGVLCFRLQLDRRDLPTVIGRNGFTISAIRSLLSVAAANVGERAILRLDEEESSIGLSP